jgi:hypothetical protein
VKNLPAPSAISQDQTDVTAACPPPQIVQGGPDARAGKGDALAAILIDAELAIVVQAWPALWVTVTIV